MSSILARLGRALLTRLGRALSTRLGLALLPLLLLLSSVSMAQEAGNLTFTDTGNKAGVPIVFLHAFPLNKEMWKAQAEFLGPTARVIALDIRGLGESKVTGPYTLEFVVDDVIALLDRLKIEKAVVCGLSMGGFVALRAVERNPERFSGLILADTKSEPDSDSSKLGRYKALKMIEEKGLDVFADGFLQKAIAPTTAVDRAGVLAEAIRIAKVNSAAGVSAAILALTSRTDTTADLGKIRVPTLILQGEFDTVIPMEAAKALQKGIAGSELVVIPKAGHLSNLENPAAFNEQLGRFMAGVK